MVIKISIFLRITMVHPNFTFATQVAFVKKIIQQGFVVHTLS